MRLTLRTLLAYLDDAIDPKDAKALSQKIEESEFATGLMQRLRGVTHKPRLPAPKVDGKGLGLDANSVAEYIESTLPAERVAEFERLCIESDMHLAEVAATHQILTLVLGRPAEVTNSLRQRIYRIDPAEAGKPKTEAPQAAKVEATVAKAPEKKRWVEDPPHATPKENILASANTVHDDLVEREVPEYLRSGRETNRWPWILAGIAGFLMTAVVLRAMGPFNREHPLARLLGSAPRVETDHGIPPLPQIEMPAVAEPEPKPQPSPVPEPQPNPQIERPVVPVEPVIPAQPQPQPQPMEPQPQPEPQPVPEPVKPLPQPVEPVEPAKPEPNPEPNPEPAAPVKPKPAAVTDVGRFISDEQVLTRFDEKTGLWTRIPAKALLTSNERIVSLPVFRPLLALPSGVQITLLGEAHFQMLPPGDAGAPRIALDQGRMSLVTDGVPGGKIDLNLAGLELLLTLNDADSVVTVDVRPYLSPGSDPQKDDAIRVIEIFSASGQATLEQAGEKPLEIRPNFVATFLNQEPANVTGPFQPPEWLDIRNTKDIDRDAARYVEKALVPTRPLPILLTELLQDRRVEVRSLAARSLAILGECDGLAAELADARQATFWNAEIETFRSVLARNPEAAEKVRESLLRQYGDRGPELYRLLWGYSPEQLAEGAALELVKGLESTALEHRVLASHTLERITGALFAYRAAARPETNKPSILRFRERVQDGQLIYKTAPNPASEFKALK